MPQEGHLHHLRSSWGPQQIGVYLHVCVFSWVSVSMHAWAILSWGDCRRQGGQSEGPGLSQLISSRGQATNRPAAAGWPAVIMWNGWRGERLPDAADSCSKSLSEAVWPHLIWSDPSSYASCYTMFHLVQSVELVPVCVLVRIWRLVCAHLCVCVCWNLVMMLNAWIGYRPGQRVVTISCNTVKQKKRELEMGCCYEAIWNHLIMHLGSYLWCDL